MTNLLTQHTFASEDQRFERFDWLTIGVIALLLIAIGGVVLGGDRAGVGATLNDSSGQAASDQTKAVLTSAAPNPLHLTFTERMNRNSVHLTLQPDVPFAMSWVSDTDVIIAPKPAFAPGQKYAITLNAGAQAVNGRPVHDTLVWTVAIEPLRVVYLAPAQPVQGHHDPTNLWTVTPTSATGGAMPVPTQLTHSTYGVVDFAISPDGRQIAFSQLGQGQTSDLYLLDVATGAVRPITNCVNAPCNSPSWSPDGTRLIYQRADTTRPDSNVRAWLLDLKTLQTVPVFNDSKWLGKEPRWSSDGQMISVYDGNSRGIDLIDLNSGQHSVLPTEEDYSGSFAPGGRPQIAIEDLSTTPYGVVRHLSIADYQAHTVTSLAPTDGTLADDQAVSWSPNGNQLAVMRHLLDSGSPGAQIYLMDVQTGAATPLLVDEQYAQGALSWSPDASKLLFQRFPIEAQNGQTAIWTYDLFTKRLTQVAANGFYPQWLP